MGKPRTDSDGNSVSRVRKQAPPETVAPSKTAPNPLPSPHEIVANKSALADNLAWFCNQINGWLRVVPTNDEGVIYFKWKFNGGDWPNHYVMARVQWWQSEYGLSVLRSKVEAVQEGNATPQKDTYFSS